MDNEPVYTIAKGTEFTIVYSAERRLRTAVDFISESNYIEGIHREPTEAEINEYLRFMELDSLTLEELEKFVAVYQPDAKLRSECGMNVRVGTHFPPCGGVQIPLKLAAVLEAANLTREVDEYPTTYKQSYLIHQEYETLHPFMDGNGRSGRMIWQWMMREERLGFLHRWYYQSLEFSRDR